MTETTETDDELLSVRLLLADAVVLLRAVQRDYARRDVAVFLARLDHGTRCARSRFDDHAPVLTDVSIPSSNVAPLPFVPVMKGA